MAGCMALSSEAITLAAASFSPAGDGEKAHLWQAKNVGSSSVPLIQAVAVDDDLHLAPDRFNSDPGPRSNCMGDHGIPGKSSNQFYHSARNLIFGLLTER